MIPLLRSVIHALLWDAMAARRWLRGAMLAFSGGGLAFADNLAGIVGAPGAVKAIKVAAVVCGFVAGAISVGEPNPKPTPPLAPEAPKETP